MPLARNGGCKGKTFLLNDKGLVFFLFLQFHACFYEEGNKQDVDNE